MYLQVDEHELTHNMLAAIAFAVCMRLPLQPRAGHDQCANPHRLITVNLFSQYFFAVTTSINDKWDSRS